MTIPRNLSILAEGASSTGVLAATNGGTGQTTASAAFNALSPITTTGDLIIGNGTNSATRLAIGTNNYVLTSNGTTATWAAAVSGGGLTLLANLTPGSGVTQIDATSLAQSKSFLIITDSLTMSAGCTIKFATSSDNGSTYVTSSVFTNSSANPTGFVQMFRADIAGTPKPITNINGGSTGTYSVTTPTGIINAIRFTINNASTFTGVGNIFVYGMN